MEISMNLEIDLQAGVDLFLISPIHEKLEGYFKDKNYGTGISKFAIILVCRPSYLNLKQRKRFDKKTKILYLDVVLNFEYAGSIIDKTKLKQYVNENLRDAIIFIAPYKKKIADFDFDAFERDWKKLFWEYVWW